MAIIRCTQKLLAELRIKPGEEADTNRNDSSAIRQGRCGGAGSLIATVGAVPSPHPSPPRGEGGQEALRAPIGSETGWHANLLRIERRKCVLFTHDETLFSFLLCGLTRPDFEHFPDLFGQGLFNAMLRSGFATDQIEPMLETTLEIRFAKTNNRSVLGSMNDMAQMLEWTISSRGGLAAANPNELQRLLNETPFKSIGYAQPIRCMRTFLDTQDSP